MKYIWTEAKRVWIIHSTAFVKTTPTEVCDVTRSEWCTDWSRACVSRFVRAGFPCVETRRQRYTVCSEIASPPLLVHGKRLMYTSRNKLRTHWTLRRKRQTTKSTGTFEKRSVDFTHLTTVCHAIVQPCRSSATVQGVQVTSWRPDY